MTAISDARHSRLDRIRVAMQEHDVDCCLLSLGAELPWCTGYEAMPLERPTVLVIPKEGEATLVVPALEAPRVAWDESLHAMRPWSDAEDAIAIIAGLMGSVTEIAISDHAFAMLMVDLQQALPKTTWHRASSVIGSLRAVKDAAELAALAAAAQAADRVANQLLAGEIPLIGRAEIDVSRDISQRLLDEGHAKVNFAIVGSGPNAASPHHEPGSRIIGVGETVVCDFGGGLHLGDDIAYCSDITRTVVTGEPSSEIRDAYDVLEAAQHEAVLAVQPGVTCESIDAVGRNIIENAGYGEYFMHRIGHGIGAEAHEDPYIVSGNTTKLVPGHAFSVEPGIYIAGRFGARIEDIVAVTESGVDALNTADHSLHIVEA